MGNLFSMLSNLITYLVGGTIGTGQSAVTVEGWIPQFVDVIVDNDLLLFFVGLSLVGIAVGFITRLIHARG